MRKTGKTNENSINDLKINSEFINIMIHELKTPLNFINTASSLLLDYYMGQFDERAVRLIETIKSSGIQLKKLIKNFMDIFQIESGKIKLNKQKENITELLSNCLNDLVFLIDEKKINLKSDFQRKFCASVDKLWFNQVISNVISNAINHTSVKGEIFINLEQQNQFLDIKIKDTGVGFTETEKKKAFKKFGRIIRDKDDVKDITEGTGLGLYISKEIIELHGGKIWIQSEGRNKGSTIIMRLPVNEYSF